MHQNFCFPVISDTKYWADAFFNHNDCETKIPQFKTLAGKYHTGYACLRCVLSQGGDTHV